MIVNTVQCDSIRRDKEIRLHIKGTIQNKVHTVKIQTYKVIGEHTTQGHTHNNANAFEYPQ
jgi:hypothetical protein